MLFSLLTLVALTTWNGEAQASIDCKAVKPELQQIHALLQAFESSEGDAQGHFAVATGLLRRLEAVGRAANQSSITDNVNSTVRSLRVFLSSMGAEGLASREQVGYSKERLSLARAIRHTIRGIECLKSKDADGAESAESDEMATRLLKAAAEEDSSDEAQIGKSIGPSSTAINLSHWKGGSDLEVNVATILLSCVFALAFVEFVERRRQKRFMTRIPATVHYGDNEFEITIFDLSSGGARLSTLPGVRTGDKISLAVADQKFDAEIRWLGEKCFGIRFDEKIDRFQLMRVQGVGLLK